MCFLIILFNFQGKDIDSANINSKIDLGLPTPDASPSRGDLNDIRLSNKEMQQSTDIMSMQHLGAPTNMLPMCQNIGTNNAMGINNGGPMVSNSGPMDSNSGPMISSSGPIGSSGGRPVVLGSGGMGHTSGMLQSPPPGRSPPMMTHKSPAGSVPSPSNMNSMLPSHLQAPHQLPPHQGDHHHTPHPQQREHHTPHPQQRDMNMTHNQDNMSMRHCYDSEQVSSESQNSDMFTANMSHDQKSLNGPQRLPPSSSELSASVPARHLLPSQLNAALRPPESSDHLQDSFYSMKRDSSSENLQPSDGGLPRLTPAPLLRSLPSGSGDEIKSLQASYMSEYSHMQKLTNL